MCLVIRDVIVKVPSAAASDQKLRRLQLFPSHKGTQVGPRGRPLASDSRWLQCSSFSIDQGALNARHIAERYRAAGQMSDEKGC